MRESTADILANFPVASFDEAASRLKAAIGSPFALQIGAMDGMRNDLLHQHLFADGADMGWRGLLVEPVPEMFAQLRETYADCPTIELANCAIADYDGHINMHRVDTTAVEAGLVDDDTLGMTSTIEDNSIVNDVAQARQDTPVIAQDNMQAIEVACVTLPRLLHEHDVEHVDLFMVDCEGADWMIARQLDLKKHKPFVVCIAYTSLSGEDMGACAAHFVGNGYRLALCKEDNQNLLFIRKG